MIFIKKYDIIFIENKKEEMINMKICCRDCIPSCENCKYVILDKFINSNGEEQNGGSIGCTFWDDEKHQQLAEMGLYCDDFYCKNLK